MESTAKYMMRCFLGALAATLARELAKRAVLYYEQNYYIRKPT